MDRFTAIAYDVSSVSDVSECLPFLVWIRYSLWRRPYIVLGILFGISLVIKLFTLISAELYMNNMPAFHLLACVEIVMLFCFYSQLCFNRIYWCGILLLLIVNTGNSVLFQGLYTFNSLAWTINMMVLIFMGIFYLFRLYNDDTDMTPLEKRPGFIINMGWLIYAAGSLFTYLMGTAILSGKPEGFFYNAWVIQCVSNLAKNFIVSYGLWQARQDYQM